VTIRIATANDPAYGELLALVQLKKARYLGERYNDDGLKEIAVDVRGKKKRRGKLTPNDQIRIGREFFTTALKDYEDWQEKWWREAVQNAVDAGSTQVACTVQERAGGVEVICEDNGGGMDEDTLLNKFLVLGGTTKKGATGGVGGFGKAKELLVLPWLSWEVHSRNHLVVGSGIEYVVERVDEHLKGTRLTVLMPADQATHAAAAISFIGKCLIPRVRFTVNGDPVKANLKKGTFLRDFGDGAASLYHNKRKDSFNARMLVRANGIYMFGLYVTSEVPGSLIVELNKPSVDLLTANRDGFRNSQLRWQVADFANELAADVKSAVRKKKGLIREKFKGTGRFSSRFSDAERAADILGLEGVMLPKGRGHVLSADQIGMAKEVLERHGGDEETVLADPTNLIATPGIAGAMLTGTKMLGPTQVEAVVKQLAWEPDFFLVNEVDGWRIPRKFYPENMGMRVRQLLRYWAEMCRFVLMQLGSTRTYGVGFVFDSETAAAYIREDGEDWLMVNPYRGHPEHKPMLRLASAEDVNWLYAAAVHEVTHIADGISYHNESFAAAFTYNVARTVGGLKRLSAIKKAIVAKEPKKRSPKKDTYYLTDPIRPGVPAENWHVYWGDQTEASSEAEALRKFDRSHASFEGARAFTREQIERSGKMMPAWRR
jgi:hypothetical protein